MKTAVLLAVAAVTLSATHVTTQTGQPLAEVVIRDVAIVDVAAGRLVPGQDLVVRGTRVDRIAPAGGPLPPGKITFDGRGKFAMPGLIAAGVRLSAFTPAGMQALLAQGLTAVRDSGATASQLARWRDDLNSGRMYSPRIVDGCPSAGAPPAPASAAPADAPGAIHDELQRLVTTARRPPADALRQVTLDRARALCLDGLGRIAAGLPADLVILTGNPLDDIGRTRDIDAVIFRGEVLTRAHLNMLARGALPLPTPTPPR